MISLLPFHRIITFVAVIYAAFVVGLTTLVALFFQPLNLLDALKIALAGAGVLQLLLLMGFSFGWKWLWAAVPALNQLVFPNIEGRWKMRIEWQGQDMAGGVVQATAVIRQDFNRISMEVLSPGSDSETLIALPRKDHESGRPLLYYVYRVVPKALSGDAGHSYEGSAILKLSKANELSGNYFTSRNTRGHFTLTKNT